MDLDGTCYNMVQHFTDWCYHTNRIGTLPEGHFYPEDYRFWESWDQSDTWFRETLIDFIKEEGFSDPLYTLHGFGLALWRHANRLKVPVAVVTARYISDKVGERATQQTYEWMFHEGLSADLVMVIEPTESKVDRLEMHLTARQKSDRSTIISVEDHLANANAYQEAGFLSLLVDRPWNWENVPFDGNSPYRVFDSCWVDDQSIKIHTEGVAVR
jgi:hypothetical protein